MAKNGKETKDYVTEMNLPHTPDPTVISQSKRQRCNEISSKIS